MSTCCAVTMRFVSSTYLDDEEEARFFLFFPLGIYMVPTCRLLCSTVFTDFIKIS